MSASAAADTILANEPEAERELRQRRELLRHLQGHRTQALPKHSLFGTRT